MNIDKLIVPEGCHDLTIREGSTPDPLPLYNYQGFRYKADTTPSFVELVKRKGVQENAVIFADEDGFFAILDDQVKDRKQDTVSHPFALSVRAQEWSDVLTHGKVFGIKGIVDFLKRRDENEIDNLPELLYAMQNFKYVSNITGDFTFDSRNNYTFAVKVAEAEGTVRIPPTVYATLELFEASGWSQTMEIELEIRKPKDAGESPMIALSCPKFERYLKAAKDKETEDMKRQLDGWLVVSGSKL